MSTIDENSLDEADAREQSNLEQLAILILEILNKDIGIDLE